MTAKPVTIENVRQARISIADFIRHTPLVKSASLSRLTGTAVHLKLETLQATGAFKLRGATNKLRSLSAEELQRGVVCCSTGNHGRAVAMAAKQLGVSAVVCMSSLVPAIKVDAIKALGADVRIVGSTQDEADVEVERLVGEDGRVNVSPFDDPHVIAGQGTIGLELLEDLPHIDTVIVPLSGGGLICGIALALKAHVDVRVIGVSMDRGAAMYESCRAGQLVPVAEEASLADSLTGGIGADNQYTFPMARELVDDMILVTEDEIAAGMKHALREERMVVEGGGAVSIAALLAGKVHSPGKHVACVISGNNVDIDKLLRICA